jgi:hypothetical protein
MRRRFVAVRRSCSGGASRRVVIGRSLSQLGGLRDALPQPPRVRHQVANNALISLAVNGRARLAGSSGNATYVGRDVAAVVEAPAAFGDDEDLDS